MKRLLALAATMSCAPTVPSSTAPRFAPLPPLLVAFREATGGAAWDRIQAITTHAAAEFAGMTGTADTIEDVPTGRSRAAIKVGGFEQAEGFDGTTAWERTPGGEVFEPDAPAALAIARTTTWMTRRGYFHADGTTYAPQADRIDGGTRYHVIEATPERGAPIELWFDPAGLLARTTYRQGTQLVTTDFTDWRPVGEVKLPFRVISVQGDAGNTVALTVIEAKAVPTPDATTFAAPRVDDARVTFAHGAQRSDVPFELVNNHIYAHATIDGRPARVLVDTGGINMVTPAAADRLGLVSSGKLSGRGAGEQTVDVAIAHAKSLVVGDVTLADPVFLISDLGRLADVEGEDFDGLIGYELFSRLRVRIDYPARTLTLIAPAAFSPPPTAIAVPFEIHDRIPVVRGAIDGVPGRFWIDTGSRAALSTMARFTRDHDLVAKYHPAFETVTGWGFGGKVTSAPVRFHEVKLGEAVVHDVVGDLFTGSKGALADPDAAANVGGGILSRFIVSFDYAAKVMYLEPAKDGDRRDAYDRSGMFLARDPRGLRVIALVPRGPAERAGIRVDETITAIDGTSTTNQPLTTWRRYLSDAPPRSKVRLRVEAAPAAQRDVVITVEELVP